MSPSKSLEALQLMKTVVSLLSLSPSFSHPILHLNIAQEDKDLMSSSSRPCLHFLVGLLILYKSMVLVLVCVPYLLQKNDTSSNAAFPCGEIKIMLRLSVLGAVHGRLINEFLPSGNQLICRLFRST